MRFKLYSIILMLVFTVVGTAAGQVSQKELADLVNKQQAMLDEMQAEIDDLNSYVEEDEGDMFGDIDIHGYISQGYVKSEKNNWFMEDSGGQGSFQFNEIGINFTSQLSDNLRVGMQLLSRDFGAIDNNKVQIDWAYFDYKVDDWLGLRVGKVKTPLGLMSETRDIDMLRTTIFLPFTKIYDEATRESFNTVQGLSVYGNVDFDSLGALNYNVQWGYSTYNVEDGGVATLIEGSTTSGVNTIGKVNDIENRKAFVSRINWDTPIDGLLLGLAYMKHDTDLDVETGIPLGPTVPVGTEVYLKLMDYKTYVASLQYTVGELVLTSEFARTTYQTDFAGVRTIDYEEQSWYMMADYRVNSLLSLAAGYASFTDAHDPDGHHAEAAGEDDYSAWTKDIFVSSKFDLTDNWVLKAEVHFLDGYMFNLPSINPDGQERRDVLLALKTTVSF